MRKDLAFREPLAGCTPTYEMQSGERSGKDLESHWGGTPGATLVSNIHLLHVACPMNPVPHLEKA